jgi:hypothetical protein
MAVEKTLAYSNTATFTAIKSFIVQAPEPNFTRILWPLFTNVCCKLEFLSPSGLSSLVHFFKRYRVRPQPIHSGAILLALPTNIRLGWKGLPEKNTLAFLHICKLRL